jgi:hypothetical protein
MKDRHKLSYLIQDTRLVEHTPTALLDELRQTASRQPTFRYTYLPSDYVLHNYANTGLCGQRSVQAAGSCVEDKSAVIADNHGPFQRPQDVHSLKLCQPHGSPLRLSWLHFFYPSYKQEVLGRTNRVLSFHCNLNI